MQSLNRSGVLSVIDYLRGIEMDREGFHRYGSWDIPLSSRQVEILRLVREGHTNKLIGYILDIKENTVKSHIRRAAERLDARDRTSAVIKAIRQGYMEVENERD